MRTSLTALARSSRAADLDNRSPSRRYLRLAGGVNAGRNALRSGRSARAWSIAGERPGRDYGSAVEMPGSGMGRGWRARVLRAPGLVTPAPGAGVASLSWIGEERIAVGGVPAAGSVAGLAGRGVTHVVNCRSREEARLGGDLAAERAAFGVAWVAHAPMRDLGFRQRPRLWAEAALFTARVLDDQPGAR